MYLYHKKEGVPVAWNAFFVIKYTQLLVSTSTIKEILLVKKHRRCGVFMFVNKENHKNIIIAFLIVSLLLLLLFITCNKTGIINPALNMQSTTEAASIILDNDSNIREVEITDNIQNRTNAWYYNTLNDLEKRIYNTLLGVYGFDMNAGICNVETIALQSDEPFSLTNIKNGLHAMLYDRPEIFWIKDMQLFEIPYNEEKYKTVLRIEEQYSPVIYKADALEFRINYNNAIEKIKKNFKGKYFEEKISVISEQIEEFSNYRRTSNIINSVTSDETRSVGYFLSHKEGGCVAYAKCFQLLCQGLGIECTVISGKCIRSNQLVGHMWCAVKADDAKWYQVEPQERFATLDGQYTKTNEGYIIDNGTYLDELDPNQCDMSLAYYAVPNLSLKDYEEVHEEDIFNRTGTRVDSVEYTICEKNGEKYAKAVDVDRKTCSIIRKITIPKEVEFKGKKYEVKLIDSYTFIDCDRLKTVIVKGKDVKFKKDSFPSKKVSKEMVVKVPKKSLKKYKKRLKDKKVAFEGKVK